MENQPNGKKIEVKDGRRQQLTAPAMRRFIR